jgi:hypothetical protein
MDFLGLFKKKEPEPAPPAEEMLPEVIPSPPVPVPEGCVASEGLKTAIRTMRRHPADLTPMTVCLAAYPVPGVSVLERDLYIDNPPDGNGIGPAVVLGHAEEYQQEHVGGVPVSRGKSYCYRTAFRPARYYDLSRPVAKWTAEFAAGQRLQQMVNQDATAMHNRLEALEGRK